MPEVYDITDPVPDKKPVKPEKKDAGKKPEKTSLEERYKPKPKGPPPPPDPRKQKMITGVLSIVIVAALGFVVWWTVIRNSGSRGSVIGEAPGAPQQTGPGRPTQPAHPPTNRALPPPGKKGPTGPGFAPGPDTGSGENGIR